MKNPKIFVVAACLAASLLAASAADAGEWMCRRWAPLPEAPWQPAYYDTAWGMPQALVVPPTARTQVSYGWSVSETRRTGFPQYAPIYPGPSSVYNSRAYLPAPPQPSNTDQMGDYSVRGPR